jgi:YVTN family beta-propeller protein
MKRFLLLGLLALPPLAGCDGDAVCDSSDPDCQPPPADADAVFVVNQGNFSSGNGTVGRYDPTSGEVDSTDALGSLLQSATLYDGRIYVAANTGNRVDVFDAATFQRVLQLPVASPRYLAFVSPTKAYVTSQFYDFGGAVRPDLVTVVNPQTGATLDTVQVGGNAEGIAVVVGRAYVATGAFSESENVVVLDTATDAVIDTIDVGCAPRLVLADAEGDVFVVCTGGASDEVVVLDGATGAEEARIAVGAVSTLGPGQEAFLEPQVNELYVARADRTVLRIDTRTNAVERTLGPFGTDALGAIAYDAPAGRLYVAHAPAGGEFTLGGYVTAHDYEGAEVGRFSAGGVAPSHLVVTSAFGPD